MKIHTVLPNTGLGTLQLWCVSFRSSYYDDDPRMPGMSSVEPNYFVLATGYYEAIAACEEPIEKLIVEHNLRRETSATTARPVMLDMLAPGATLNFLRHTSGYHDYDLKRVEIENSPLSGKFRLAVCLIEDEESTT